MKFYVQNKLVTIGGSSVILNENKEEVYRVKGKVFTISKKKLFLDANGKVLYQIRNTFIHKPMMKSAFLCDAKGKKILKVRESLRFSIGYNIFYGDKEMVIEGQWFKNLCKIIEDGKVIATVRRQLTLFVDKFEVETYDVEDPAFCLALVICMDNIQDQNDITY